MRQNVTGSVDIKCYKGNAIVVGRSSPVSLYSADLASMEIESGGATIDYDPSDAQGFIRCNSTRLKAYNLMRGCPADLKKK